MTSNMKLLDWLDDLCVRFIVNLPHEELQSVERICFQIEEAQWFYEDFIRPLDHSLPSMNLRTFSQQMFRHCPLFAEFTEAHREEAYAQFLEYKTRVPVRGAIMLNQDMTHAVLVKGWKKAAKWSFPRGKINKDENDLDCAVREVYEETGLDLREIDLVKPEHEMKYINVNLREQSLRLYVFRGVPMDTYFEPRTRKEISKIDWYKLGDLPTIKRKNQTQGNGHDLVRDNSFYMVTPFMGQLKNWIKLQKQLEKKQKQAGAPTAPPEPTEITDAELDADVGDTTADEAPIPEYTPDDGNFAELIANMGRNHRASDTLPEVQAEPTVDAASELKRLLSVGGGIPSQTRPLETPPVRQGPHGNGLLEFMQGNNRPPYPNAIPNTPFDQIMPLQMPQAPHGQHHPRPPQMGHMPPPPHFPFHPSQGPAFHNPQQHHMSPPPHNGFQQIPHQLLFSHPQNSQHHPHPPPHQHHFSPHPPHNQQSFGPPPQRPHPQTNHSQFGQQPEFQSQPGFQSQRGPDVPPASKLPPPKLTTHTLGLLNAFKINEKPANSSPQTVHGPIPSSQATPKMPQPPAIHRPSESFISSPATYSTNPYAPSPPAFQSPPPVADFEPVQPKPRNTHQNTLLNLFSSPSVTAATPEPIKSLEQPAELSAFPMTPGLINPASGPMTGPPVPDLGTKPVVMNANAPQRGNTSATVRGPVNAPDFDTMKKHSQLSVNGNSRGTSPANPKPNFAPRQILKREGTPKGSTARLVASPSPRISPQTAAPLPAVFKPQILKRPQQLPAAAPVEVAARPSARARELLDPRDLELLGTPASIANAEAFMESFKSKTRPASPGLNPRAQELLGLFKSNTSPQPVAAPNVPPPTQTLPPAAPGANPRAQELLGLFKSQPSPQLAPTPPARMPTPPQLQSSYNRRDSDQKTALLSLFGGSRPSPRPSPSPLAANPAFKLPLAATSPALPTRSPQPPTPKNIMSGVISPVSPLPTAGSQMGSPANPDPASRSRISSIGDAFSTPTGHSNMGVSLGPHGLGQRNGGGFGAEDDYIGTPVPHLATTRGLSMDVGGVGLNDKGKARAQAADGKSPVDKTFLLGFLNDFANKGR